MPRKLFEPGNKIGKGNKGRKFKTFKGITNKVIKDNPGKIEDLYELMIDKVYEGLKDLPLKDSSKLASELLKYVIPVKKESLNISFTFEDYLKQKQIKLQDELMRKQNNELKQSEVIQIEQTEQPDELKSENALASLSVSVSSGNPNQCTTMIILPESTTNKS